jgi:uncharacterized protein (TIGR04255 family)
MDSLTPQHVYSYDRMADGPLPEYQRPPVAEVALGFAFQELSAFSTVHFGLLWERFREAYPRAEDLKPMEVPREVRPDADQRVLPPRLQVLTKLPRPRCWFLTADGTQVIQVQGNAFFHNWRRNDTDGRYPRYHSVRESFFRTWRCFVSLWGSSDWARLSPRSVN